MFLWLHFRMLFTLNHRLMIFLGTGQHDIVEWAVHKVPRILNYNLYWYKKLGMQDEIKPGLITYLQKIEILTTKTNFM